MGAVLIIRGRVLDGRRDGWAVVKMIDQDDLAATLCVLRTPAIFQTYGVPPVARATEKRYIFSYRWADRRRTALPR
jgi:hypothetical protein